MYILQSYRSSHNPEASVHSLIQMKLTYENILEKHLWNGIFRFHRFAVHSAPILPPKLPPFPTSKSGSEESEEFSASLEELPCRACPTPFLRLTLSISLGSCAKSKQWWESNLFFVQYIPQNDKQYMP